ncbi:MAG TPA: hypothetical protein VMB50_21525, partial [Myxococcales bacterium]|nr:hypothetical protein [Myxococcales bacterium]
MKRTLFLATLFAACATAPIAPQPPPSPEAAALGLERGEVRGARDAMVTIVEFGDFQCPFTRRADATLRALLARHPDELRLVWRSL